jgi:hypothetical protein
MGLITSQQLATYYNTYKSTEVTFTKQINQVFGLNPKEIFLKVGGEQWHCIIYSSSLESAKVLLNLENEAAESLEGSPTTVSLRYSIKKPDAAGPISFFVPGKITSVTPYSDEKQHVKFVTVTFTQRPPDDLIEMLGILLETAMNSKKRREERIVINPNILKLLAIPTKEIVLTVQEVPHKGILRDVSFSGAKVITVGTAHLQIDQIGELKIDFEEKTIFIPGKIIRIDPVEGQKDLAVLSIIFLENQVPMEYKMRLNDYFTSGRLEITPKKG